MAEITLVRLYVMRAFYLMLFLALGSMALSSLASPETPQKPLEAVAFSFWAALALLAGVGVRYPLQMLPILFMQMTYKTLWLLAVALPLWSAGTQFDAETMRLTWAMVLGWVGDLIVIPWGYVLANYVRKPGDRWTGRARVAEPATAG